LQLLRQASRIATFAFPFLKIRPTTQKIRPKLLLLSAL
jgi:hypothetical protein